MQKDTHIHDEFILCGGMQILQKIMGACKFVLNLLHPPVGGRGGVWWLHLSCVVMDRPQSWVDDISIL